MKDCLGSNVISLPRAESSLLCQTLHPLLKAALESHRDNPDLLDLVPITTRKRLSPTESESVVKKIVELNTLWTACEASFTLTSSWRHFLSILLSRPHHAVFQHAARGMSPIEHISSQTPSSSVVSLARRVTSSVAILIDRALDLQKFRGSVVEFLLEEYCSMFFSLVGFLKRQSLHRPASNPPLTSPTRSLSSFVSQRVSKQATLAGGVPRSPPPPLSLSSPAPVSTPPTGFELADLQSLIRTVLSLVDKRATVKCSEYLLSSLTLLFLIFNEQLQDGTPHRLFEDLSSDYSTTFISAIQIASTLGFSNPKLLDLVVPLLSLIFRVFSLGVNSLKEWVTITEQLRLNPQLFGHLSATLHPASIVSASFVAPPKSSAERTSRSTEARRPSDPFLLAESILFLFLRMSAHEETASSLAMDHVLVFFSNLMAILIAAGRAASSSQQLFVASMPAYMGNGEMSRFHEVYCLILHVSASMCWTLRARPTLFASDALSFVGTSTAIVRSLAIFEPLIAPVGSSDSSLKLALQSLRETVAVTELMCALAGVPELHSNPVSEALLRLFSSLVFLLQQPSRLPSIASPVSRSERLSSTATPPNHTPAFFVDLEDVLLSLFANCLFFIQNFTPNIVSTSQVLQAPGGRPPLALHSRLPSMQDLPSLGTAISATSLCLSILRDMPLSSSTTVGSPMQSPGFASPLLLSRGHLAASPSSPPATVPAPASNISRRRAAFARRLCNLTESSLTSALLNIAMWRRMSAGDPAALAQTIQHSGMNDLSRTLEEWLYLLRTSLPQILDEAELSASMSFASQLRSYLFSLSGHPSVFSSLDF